MVYSVMNNYMDMGKCPQRLSEIQRLTEMEFQQLIEELKRSGKFHLMGARMVETVNGEVIDVKGHKVVPNHPTIFWEMIKDDQECHRAIATILQCSFYKMPVNRENGLLMSRYFVVLMDQACITPGFDGRLRLTRGFKAYLERNGVNLNLE